MLVRLLVESDMFSVFPYYGLEKKSLILSALFLIYEVLTQ